MPRISDRPARVAVVQQNVSNRKHTPRLAESSLLRLRCRHTFRIQSVCDPFHGETEFSVQAIDAVNNFCLRRAYFEARTAV